MIGKKLTRGRGRYLRGAELPMTTNDEPRRRSWISLWALGAVIALASTYGVATARALESGDYVQFLIRADANQPEPNDQGMPDGIPETFLIYGSASGTVDARGCIGGDRPVQSARLVQPGHHAGNPTVEVITTFQSGDLTTPVEPGTRIGNLSFVGDCAILVGDTWVAYKKYAGRVK